MAWITDEQRETYIELGYTCKDCVFRYDCKDDEICLDFTVWNDDADEDGEV